MIGLFNFALYLFDKLINENEIVNFQFFPDLRKEFEVPPYSQSVELRSQIELRCHPPKGVPKPRVRNSIQSRIEIKIDFGNKKNMKIPFSKQGKT